MKKICIVLMIIAFVSFVSSGCGKKKIKPSQDSLMTQEALRITNIIKTAYEKKDHDALRDNLSPELGDVILKGLFFEKAELSFTPRMVRLRDSLIMVNLNWHGNWSLKGKTFRDRGSGILVFQARPMKLIQIDRDNPFTAPIFMD